MLGHTWLERRGTTPPAAWARRQAGSRAIVEQKSTVAEVAGGKLGLGDLLRLATVVHSALSTPPFSGSSPERPLPIQGPRSSAARDGLPPSECSGDSPCALRDRDVPAPGSDPKGKVDGSTADTPRIPATPLGGDGRRRPGASPGPLGRSGARRCARIQRKQGGQR